MPDFGGNGHSNLSPSWVGFRPEGDYRLADLVAEPCRSASQWHSREARPRAAPAGLDETANAARFSDHSARRRLLIFVFDLSFMIVPPFVVVLVLLTNRSQSETYP